MHAAAPEGSDLHCTLHTIVLKLRGITNASPVCWRSRRSKTALPRRWLSKRNTFVLHNLARGCSVLAAHGALRGCHDQRRGPKGHEGRDGQSKEHLIFIKCFKGLKTGHSLPQNITTELSCHPPTTLSVITNTHVHHILINGLFPINLQIWDLPGIKRT